MFESRAALLGVWPDETDRHITMQAQTFDPSDEHRQRILLPLVFCRECGQDYYAVARTHPDVAHPDETPSLLPRALGNQNPEQREPGFPYRAGDARWPQAETPTPTSPRSS